MYIHRSYSRPVGTYRYSTYLVVMGRSGPFVLMSLEALRFCYNQG